MIDFVVPGIARPAGSKRGFPIRLPTGRTRVVITDDNAKSRDWKQQVAFFARQAYSGDPLAGPLQLAITFYITRPKGHLRTNGALKPSAPPFPVTKPDATKLVRAVEDALTRIAWIDDAQVVTQWALKRYANPLEGPRTHVKVLAQETRP